MVFRQTHAYVCVYIYKIFPLAILTALSFSPEGMNRKVILILFFFYLLWFIQTKDYEEKVEVQMGRAAVK